MKTLLTVFVLLMSGCCMATYGLKKGNNWPCEDPVDCSEGEMFGDPADCNCYYQCNATGHLVRECCVPDACFHPFEEECTWCHLSEPECQQPCPTTVTLIELTHDQTTARPSVSVPLDSTDTRATDRRGTTETGPTIGSSTTGVAGNSTTEIVVTTEGHDVEDNWPCENPVDCVDGDRYGDPVNCSCYYECNATGFLHHDCCSAPDQCFELALGECKYCHHVTECQQACEISTSFTGSTETPVSTSPSPRNDWPCVTPVNCSDGERFGDPANCNCYYQCNATGALVYECCPYDRQCFHPYDGQCRWCHELESGCQQPCDEKTESACYEDGAVLNMECLPSEVIVIVWRTTLFGVSQPCDDGELCCPANTSCSILLSESEHNATSAHWHQVDSCNGERACTVNVTQDISNCGEPTDYENITYRCVTATTVPGTVEMTTVTTVITVSSSRPSTTSQNPEDTWPCKHPVNCTEGDRYADPANCSCYYQCNATGFLQHDCCPVGQPDQCFEPALGECKYCENATQCQQPCTMSSASTVEASSQTSSSSTWDDDYSTTSKSETEDCNTFTLGEGIGMFLAGVITAIIVFLAILLCVWMYRKKRQKIKHTEESHEHLDVCHSNINVYETGPVDQNSVDNEATSGEHDYYNLNTFIRPVTSGDAVNKQDGKDGATAVTTKTETNAEPALYSQPIKKGKKKNNYSSDNSREPTKAAHKPDGCQDNSEYSYAYGHFYDRPATATSAPVDGDFNEGRVNHYQDDEDQVEYVDITGTLEERHSETGSFSDTGSILLTENDLYCP